MPKRQTLQPGFSSRTHFIPAAKLAANGESFSIVSDYLGTPLQAFDNNGNKVWEQELDIFGRKRRKGNNNSSFIPFKYQGSMRMLRRGCITTGFVIMNRIQGPISARTR